MPLLAQQQGGGGGQQGARRTGGLGSSSGSTRQYPSNGTIGEAVITSDPETRRLIVITDEDTGNYISQVITNLDRPKPQVLIKVVFLEVTYNNSSDMGLEGTMTRKFGNSYTGIVNQAFGLAAQGAAPVPPGAGIYTVLGNDFQATLRAIQQTGKSEVLSRPSILARNNQQATISLGQQVPLISNTRFDTLNNQINTVTYQNVGIILRVTPFITSDGMVEMIVSPEISGLADRSQWVPISSGAGGQALAPVINSRSADTVVVVPDRQTVVIGGLMENNKSQTDSKIPILGDIPLLGAAFKRKVKNNTKTELIIFLTPTIVGQPSQLAGVSARERSNTEMAPKAFPDRELQRYLDSVPMKGDSPPEPKSKGRKSPTSTPTPAPGPGG